MLMGTYEHSLDAKGRVIIPAKLRDNLGDSFVVTKGLDGCLFTYPLAEWGKLAEKLTGLPGGEDSRKLQRHFLAHATVCETDKQGRVLIPQVLREYAGLSKDILFTGLINKIEIWDKEKYEAQNSDEDIEAAVEKMADFGLSF